MRTLGLVPVLFALACASAPASSPAPAETSAAVQPRAKPPNARPAVDEPPSLPAAAENFLAAHNHHRGAVSPAPSVPLPAMRWSAEVAAHAQAVADQCQFEHSQTDYGENLSARTGTAEPAEIVADWVAEVEHYDARRNRCEPGEVCGHYTQVVWRTSTELGCATTNCTRNSPFGGGEWQLTVCNYAPAGNFSGQRPY